MIHFTFIARKNSAKILENRGKLKKYFTDNINEHYKKNCTYEKVTDTKDLNKNDFNTIISNNIPKIISLSNETESETNNIKEIMTMFKNIDDSKDVIKVFGFNNYSQPKSKVSK